MKKFFKKSLISILIVMVIFNFLLTPFQTSYAGVFEIAEKGITSLFNGGITGVMTWAIRAGFLAVVVSLHRLVCDLAQIGTVKGLNDDNTSSIANALDAYFVTPFHIFFNRIELLDVNFFDFSNTGSTMGQFRIAVAGWYYTMRLIASMALVVILIYIGIRMAISTLAQEKAMYQKMLVDWLTSLALLFVLHYIMVFVLMINEALVDAMYRIAQATDMTNFLVNLVDLAIGNAAGSTLLAFMAIGVYAMIVFQTFSFLLSYIKRMLNIGFLIIIAPLITITYSLDKIGDGKAQALNTWLKEFVYNILIQPFHCILYLAFAQIAFRLLSNEVDASSMARAILAVLCIQYIKTGEELVRKIFGFKADSLASMATGTAMAMTAMSQAGNVAKKVGNTAAGLSRTVAKNVNVPKLKTSFKEGAKQLSEQREERKVEKRAMKDLQQGDKKKKIDKNSQEFRNAKENARTKIKEEREEKQKKRAQRVAGAQGKPTGEKADIKGASGTVKKWRNKISNTKPVKVVSSNVGSAVKKAGKTVGDASDKVGEKFKAVAGSPTAKTLADNFAKPLAGIPMGLAKDAKKYLSNHENQGKILSKAVGTVVGFGALGAGDFASAVTGYKAGSGLIEGYFENSTTTLREGMRDTAGCVSTLTGEESGDVIATLTWALKKSGAFEKMSEKIDALAKKLMDIKVNGKSPIDEKSARRVINTIRTEIISNPENVNQEFIENTMREEDTFKGLDEDNFKNAYNLLKEHAVLAAQASLATNLENCDKLGMDLETMGYVIGNFDNASSRTKTTTSSDTSSSTSTTTETQTENETHTETRTHTQNTVHTETKIGNIDYKQEPQKVPEVIETSLVASNYLNNSTTGITPEDIKNVNKSIEKLSDLITQFDSARKDEKEEMIREVNKNNQLLEDFNSGRVFEAGTQEAEAKFKVSIDMLKNKLINDLKSFEE